MDYRRLGRAGIEVSQVLPRNHDLGLGGTANRKPAAGSMHPMHPSTHPSTPASPRGRSFGAIWRASMSSCRRSCSGHRGRPRHEPVHAMNPSLSP